MYSFLLLLLYIYFHYLINSAVFDDVGTGYGSNAYFLEIAGNIATILINKWLLAIHVPNFDWFSDFWVWLDFEFLNFFLIFHLV